MSAGRCWPNVGSMLIHRCLTLNQHWLKISSLPQLARNTHPMLASKPIDPMLVWCWSTVYDAGPTSNQHWQASLVWHIHGSLLQTCGSFVTERSVRGGGQLPGKQGFTRVSHWPGIMVVWGEGGLCMWMGGGGVYTLRSFCSQFMHSIFDPFRAGTDFWRQNLTTLDVRCWRLKSISAL